MMVVERKLEDQAKLLLEAGAKVDEEDKDGRTPLEMDACRHIRLHPKGTALVAVAAVVAH